MKYQYPFRLFLIAMLLFVGVWLNIQKGLYAAWYLYAAALLLAANHAMFGTVFPAFQQLQRGKREVAAALLRQVWNPKWLLPRTRGYYFLIKGMIELQNQNLDAAEYQLRQALGLYLPRPLDKAYLFLNLAHILFLKKKFGESREFLDRAKAEPVNDLVVKEHIKQLENALSTLS